MRAEQPSVSTLDLSKYVPPPPPSRRRETLPNAQQRDEALLERAEQAGLLVAERSDKRVATFDETIQWTFEGQTHQARRVEELLAGAEQHRLEMADREIALAEQATSLRDLIALMEKEIAAATRASTAADKAAAANRRDRRDERATTLGEAGRLAPAVAFARAFAAAAVTTARASTASSSSPSRPACSASLRRGRAGARWPTCCASRAWRCCPSTAWTGIRRV